MSTPVSSSSGGRKRVVASPHKAQELKLRLTSVDTITNGLYGIGLMSPVADFTSSTPSQLQPLTPELNGRHSIGTGTNAWSQSTNLLSNSVRNASCHNNSTAMAKAPPALDIVSPAATNRYSVSGNGRSWLPDLATRKDVQMNSVDVSTERCALSPSLTGGGRSLAFTPTFETSNNNTLSITPPRTSTSTTGDGATASTATPPPPNAPRSYSKRTGGSRDSVPLPRSSLGSSQRPSVGSGNAESPTHRSAPAEESRQSVDLIAVARTEDAPVECDVAYASLSLSEYNASGGVGPRHSTRTQMAATAAVSSSTPPSTPRTPALLQNGRSAQTSSILATSTQGNTSMTTTAALTPTVSSQHSSSNRSRDGGHAKSLRAPRLTSHLFLDNDAPDCLAPTSGLQSPALFDAKHHGRLRSSRGSSEGRVSISTESSQAAVSPVFGASRPNALNFARGELIGKGSFGAVYRGMQRNTNRIICMKEIRLPGIVEEMGRLQASSMVAEDASPRSAPSTPPPQPVAADAKEKGTLLKQIETVKRELDLLKQLSHPNIVKYLNDEVVDGYLRIYMEYVSGGSVASAIKTYGSFAEPQAAALCYQLLQGLVYLHSRGIVHRDLKGDNLLLETSSELKIADFGTAKSIIASATMTANIVGTAYFMAPEVLRPDSVVGTPADIWSTGCCVIEMLTGKPPLSDIPNQYSVMMAIAGSPQVPLDKYIPADNTWSSEVLDFIKQCLRVNPASRPTAQELLQHPWITKYCDDEVMRKAAMSATATTSPTPPVERLVQPQASAGTVPTSPDAVVTTSTPDFAGRRSTPSASPLPRSRRNSISSATPREKKSKRDKRAAALGNTGTSSSSSSTLRRHHSRDSASENNNNSSNNSNNVRNGGGGGGSRDRRGSANVKEAMNLTPSPPPMIGVYRVGEEATAPIPVNLHPMASTHFSVNSGTSTHSTQMKASGTEGGSRTCFSVKDDERQTSFSYDGLLPTPSRWAQLTAQVSGSFLPAIHGTTSASGAAAPANSFDGLRGTRYARHLNVGGSRDETRVYHYPNEDDLLMSRESTRLGKDFFGDGHDYNNDVADGTVRYGSTTRIVLPETGLEHGVYSTLDCLTAPPAAEDPPSRRAGRGN